MRQSIKEHNHKLASHLNRIVTTFFEQSILLFQDDSGFATSLQCHFFRFLPSGLRINMQASLVEMLKGDLVMNEASFVDSKAL